MEGLIKKIQSITNVPICIDTEGAQVRTGEFELEKCELRENSILKITKKEYWVIKIILTFHQLIYLMKLK